MKRTILLSLTILALTGCASLQYAGNASYSVKPFKDDTGAISGYSVDVHNGKEIANLEAHITMSGDNFTVDLKEQGVAAFQGQQIAAGAASEAAKVATTAALTAGAVLIAPVAVPVMGASLGAAAASGTAGALAVGAGGGVLLNKAATSSAPAP